MFDVSTVAACSEFSGDIAKDEKLADEADLIVLEGVFSSGGSSYGFKIKSNGGGAMIYSDFVGDTEEFDHEVNVEILQREIEEAIGEEIALQSQQNALDESKIRTICAEVTAEKLEEVFWEEINQTLENPFFRSFYDGDEWGEEFQTKCGTVDEFIEFLELCLLTEREVIAGNEDYLVVEAESEFDEAGISDCNYYSERVEELVGIACAHFRPSGFRYDYKDGCYDRYSGYSMSSESVSISLRESANAPAREKMLGMVRLKEKLSMMEVEGEKIKRLTAF